MAGTGRTRAGRRGKRVAVQFVVNYEEGGENCILHGDAASEAFLSEIVGALPWPGQRHANMESHLRVRRARRLLAPLARVHAPEPAGHGLRRRHRDAAQPRGRGGHGRGRLGDRQPRPAWIDYRDHSPQAERADIDAAVALQTRAAGNRPLGLYQGRTLDQHVALAAAEGGFLYLRRFLRRRSAVLDRRPARAAARRPLHARRQRHAVRDTAGLQQRRPVLRLPQGHVRCAVPRGRDAAGRDDVGGASLPPGRPPGPGRRPGTVPRLCRRPSRVPG